MQLKKLAPRRLWILAGYAAAAAALFSAPLFVGDFRLNLLAKFLAFAIVALGLDLIWGYTGILSLGHGIFFGLGAYAMAMYLKLEASGGKPPDFMGWSGLKELPLFWRPFESFGFAVAAGIAIPAVLALVLGYFTFRNRIRGVYFTILTQALVIITTTLLIGQQAYTGGTNGITGYSALLGFSLGSPDTKRALYWITAAALISIFVLCRFLTGSRFGKVLRAIRDGENRVRFIGYDPAIYQMVAFTISAAIAGIAGMLFVLHVGIISPSMLGIVPSIEMVLWVAIGGRGTLIGAALGAILMNWAKSEFSTAYPEGWTLFMGLLFVLVVVFMPKGVAGLAGQLNWRKKRREPRHEGVRNPAV
ncbi:urea ABC transporter permease subunit UrtC [Paenibacillus arenilitoris]|uniref:Urea ABC transporter permease subunit UrtC n=1 Tax=Paenibacillus arenilitoris TaxID=2772299 RepID=A0A927H8L0_9BACL|nr:urea ABC transporter permease subunit UrtC [Paenibacillus arenilitoris]MBD2872851.1 urea ABC transporter permease subunit UrtC [Paenibacillus arenilitoris]